MISVLSSTLLKVLIEKNENQRLNDSQSFQGFKNYFVSPPAALLLGKWVQEKQVISETQI